jgi:hypothetical protein
MPKFTLELCYALGSYATLTVEAETLEDACEKAKAKVETEDLWAEFTDDAESSSELFVAGAVEGEHDTIHGLQTPLESHLPVPCAHRDLPALLRWRGAPDLLSAAKGLLQQFEARLAGVDNPDQADRDAIAAMKAAVADAEAA